MPSSCGGWPAARALPSIVELERLWYEIVREMADAGKVVKFRAPVAPLDDENTPEDESKTPVERDVVRVGPFTVSSNGEYLGYLPSQKSLTELRGELVGEFQTIGRNLQAAAPGSGYQRAVVDPASGALLSLYVDRPDWVRAHRRGRGRRLRHYLRRRTRRAAGGVPGRLSDLDALRGLGTAAGT